MTTDERYFLVRAGIRYGPYTARDLVRHETGGRVAASDLLVRESDGAEAHWGEFRAILTAPTTVPPTERAVAVAEPLARTPRNALLEIAAPVNVNPIALVAGYVGLVSLVMIVLGPVAVALGVWSLRSLAAGEAGMARALIGIICGTIATTLGIALLVAVVLA